MEEKTAEPRTRAPAEKSQTRKMASATADGLAQEPDSVCLGCPGTAPALENTEGRGPGQHQRAVSPALKKRWQRKQEQDPKRSRRKESKGEGSLGGN